MNPWVLPHHDIHVYYPIQNSDYITDDDVIAVSSTDISADTCVM
jgi:hypothetical protein